MSERNNHNIAMYRHVLVCVFLCFKKDKSKLGELRAVRPHIYNIMFPFTLIFDFFRVFFL